MSYYGSQIRKMLPKTYLRTHVANEIQTALTHFKDLQPMMDTYVYNDGTTKELMSLTGTLPVLFNDETFNIPVCLWLEESYPQSAPICYVKSTSEMMVLRGKYISSNGEVLLPYLEEWKPGECDLVSLLQVMVAIYGETVPVCMRPHPECNEQASCWLQFHRHTGLLLKTDGTLHLPLDRDDGHFFQQDNETNC